MGRREGTEERAYPDAARAGCRAPTRPRCGRVEGRAPASAPRQVRLLHHQLGSAAEVRADRIGSEAAEVHTVHHRDLAAVVSDTPTEVFDATREKCSPTSA